MELIMSNSDDKTRSIITVKGKAKRNPDGNVTYKINIDFSINDRNTLHSQHNEDLGIPEAKALLELLKLVIGDR